MYRKIEREAIKTNKNNMASQVQCQIQLHALNNNNNNNNFFIN